MSQTTNCIERLKTQNDRNGPQTLHNECNWLYPDKSVIEYHDLENVKIISYRELKAAKEIVSNHLKHILCPEFIGIDFDILEYCVPSLMLGILNSGHAFFNVPTDPATYTEIFTSLNVKYIFTTSVTSNRNIIHLFNIHEQSIYLTKLVDVQENYNRRWYHFAYAIATSGSTGTPKVVKVPHSCILPNIVDLKKILDITSSDKIAQLTNFTFDPSIIEIFLNLCYAATLFMVSKALKNETVRLLEKIFHARVTVLQITPSLLFHQWSTERLKTTILDKDSKLRILLLGGESFPSMKLLSEASHPRNTTRLFNIYGITEVSCWSSINEIVKNNVDEPCLGEPLSETIFQIRNEDNEIAIRGNGTLYIGSTTRICIVGNESEEDLNKPVFRDTGDVVSVDDQRRIFYRGRRNNIVKRFGNKMNLQELERVTTELSFVRNCVAFWDVERHKLYLCLSITDTKKEFSKLRDDIISHLKLLPAIYKPDKIIIVERFNFTTSGKICQTSLREICRNSEIEIDSVNNLYINEIFENLWNNHIKSRDAGFLMSGGTSIAALQISSAVTQAFNIEFPELIGMLLKDFTFDQCISYIRSILISRDCDKAVIGSIDMSVNDKIFNKDTKKILNTEEYVIKQSQKNFPLVSNEKHSYRWYKCRGKTYNDTLKKEENIKSLLKNISNIEILKTYNLQKCVDASPTIYRYSVTELYATVASHSGIICTVNLLKTDVSYEIKLPNRIEASVLILADFRGIVGCYDGYIYCIHLKTGDIIWKFQTQDMVKCTAIMCTQGNKIFVGSYDFNIYCLSTEDGIQIWKTKASQGGICATGCLHQQSTSVLFGTLDGSCLALHQSSGRIIWKRKLQNPIFVAPVVLRTGYALFCSVDGTLYCFDIETDCQMWRYAIYGNVFSYPVIWTPNFTSDEHIILASHNKNLYCLEMPQRIIEENEPKLKYTLQLQSPIFATTWCEDGYMFVACTDGIFKVFDLLEGKLLATKQLPGETFSSPIVHNDLAVLGCRDNHLYVLKLS
ncbi:PREDICTED: acyl-CoA synthetase family member 4 isoform X1 [Trachymyrmex septentrionalis]|uniref:acyl-CoA synthetase family member 4 isoform X1 n=1 Tax=Trachymyrmex septentrionalis TaxID=34720 RepID=UPI00084F5EE5|nr:PREDICTED: acyl-CoA synthetase family member 4 isoform X1 [Trachymyrmex septentrionalis]